MSKQMVKVTSAYERFVHWMLAISCLLLCYTGLGMMYKELNFFGVIFGGLKGLATVHDIMAIVFAISLVLAILMWWKEAGLFVFPEDWEWIKAAGRLSVAPGSCSGDRQIQSRPEGVLPDGCLMWIVDDLHGLFHVVSGEISFRGRSDGLGIHAARIGICGHLCLLLCASVSGHNR